MSATALSSANSACDPDPFEKIRTMTATLRSDLRISRQLAHGEPVYVIHDPVGFSSNRLSLPAYQTLTALGPGRTLKQAFDSLVESNHFEKDEEQEFYLLIAQLHRSSIVVLPINNGMQLFEWQQKMAELKRKNRFLSLLFMTIPLANPDQLLNRTVLAFRWLFTKSFFAIWLLAAMAAGVILYQRAAEFDEPFAGLLAHQNLVFLWVSFIGLKVWHEFGHGYACKVFGGSIPEMGTILIAGNPLAYIDASSAWSFPERRKRLIVMMGGMFFESLIAIPAVFVWAFTTNPLIESFAWNLIFTATVITLLFNLNPLMKFDGYFILGELIGIRNLRTRSDKQIHRVLKHRFLGLQQEPSEDSLPIKSLLMTYGVCSAIYRTWLILSISMVVAQRFFLVGVLMASLYILSSVSGTLKKMWRYLALSRETENIRGRAKLVGWAVTLGVPAIVFFCPMPFGVVTDGIVAADTEHYLRINTPGEFVSSVVPAGKQVEAGQPIAKLSNPAVHAGYQLAEAQLKEAQLLRKVQWTTNIVDSIRSDTRIDYLQQELDEAKRAVDSLNIVAPEKGRLVGNLAQDSTGRFLTQGTAVAVIVDGTPILRTWLNEEQLKTVVSAVGTEVQFRLPGNIEDEYRGTIRQVDPAAQTVFTEQALTFMAGGTILVDPATSQPLEPLFQVDIQAPSQVVDLSQHGSRVHLKFRRQRESIASWTVRKCMRFLYRLRAA